MNLTSRQKDLLVAIVDEHFAGKGVPFNFLRNTSGAFLVSPAARSRWMPSKAICHQLARLGMVMFEGSGREGKPTQLGIDTARSLTAKAAPVMAGSPIPERNSHEGPSSWIVEVDAMESRIKFETELALTEVTLAEDLKDLGPSLEIAQNMLPTRPWP